ncbi:MAG: hypothetical protein WCT45_00095 [Candidatus Paceibacterota bacterium]|jgi:hypothetical protein
MDATPESWSFCYKHYRTHHRFSDGSIACILCIEETVRKREPEALAMWRSILEVLPPLEMEVLHAHIEMGSVVTSDSDEAIMLRFLAAKALRTKSTVDEVLAEAIRTRSVRCILL